MRSTYNRYEHDEEHVLLLVSRGTDLDAPGSGLGIVRAQLPDKIRERAVLVVVAVIDEELEAATADSVDQRFFRQQDLPFLPPPCPGRSCGATTTLNPSGDTAGVAMECSSQRFLNDPRDAVT